MLFPEIINSITRSVLKLKVWHSEKVNSNPSLYQTSLLTKLVERNKNTLFGKEHNFSSINNYSDFSANIPVRTYEELKPYFDKLIKGENNIVWHRDIPYFAKSSGTTNAKSKFIPLSDDSIEDCHFLASRMFIAFYMNNNPEAKMFTGKSLVLGGTHDKCDNTDTLTGDLSGIIIENLPLFVQFTSVPSKETSLMKQWEQKLDSIIKETINEDVTSLSGVPSWMQVLLHRVLKVTGKDNILEVWPNLEVFFHGGVSFEPYRQDFEKLIPNKDFLYYQAYNASEGFFAIQDRNEATDMLLLLDCGVFYEFIDLKDFNKGKYEAVNIDNVKIGVNYAMVISTNSGLWRYSIGDTIKFTNLKPHRIKITGRTKHFINVFGEELVIENTDKALQIASVIHNCTVADYTVAPIFMKGNDSGAHQWMIEFKQKPESIQDFTYTLDEELKKLNSDYEAKRYNDLNIGPIDLNIAKEGLFYSWLNHKNKLGGQNKVPRLSNSREFIEELFLLNDNI